MVKMCVHHPDLRCYFSACSGLDSMGNVVYCRFLPNPDGFFRHRKVGVALPSVSNKHLSRKGVS
jgi:hypothetical protein